VRDLDLGVDFQDLKLVGVNEASVREVFARLGFKSLTERVLKLKGATQASNSDDQRLEAASPFETLVAPSVKSLDAEGLDGWLESRKAAVAVSFGENFGAFDGTELVESASIPWVWLASEEPKVIFDSKNRLRDALTAGFELRGVVSDPLLETYLIDPLRRDYSLLKICEDVLGFTPEAPDSVTQALLAWLTQLLHENLEPKLEATDQLSVLNEIELPTSRTLGHMENLGVSVDGSRLEVLSQELGERIAQVQAEAFAIIGKEINLSSPKQLQTVLFEDLGMTGTKSVKTGFSTNAESLSTLFEQTGHPFLEKLLEHREVTKMRQMVEIIVKGIAADGRVHTSYVQTGTSTGRLSSENPNLQNIPIKSEISKTIRDCFRVGEGFETLLTADYSQIEMRIMAHLSGDEGLIEAFNAGEDLHRFVGARVFGVTPAEVTPAMRSKVKAMSYGLVYGLSEYGLAKQLKISNGEAKQLMNDYFDRFGGVRNYLASVVDGAKLNGYTVTTFGRRRPFDDLKSPIFQIRENARRAALNAPIQGTAADIMKLAMIQIDQKMQEGNFKSRMLLQVHDELVFEVAAGELDSLRELVVGQMQHVVKLSVPLDVHVGVGKTWETAGH
jgi:DNA polymerase-1